MALRLKGIADPDAVAAASGVDASEVEAAMAAMTQDGWLSETPRGFRFTPEGRGWLDDLLDQERAGIDGDALDAVYARFCDHNDLFKQLVTDWQVKTSDGDQELNDHSDPEYDAAIFERLNLLDRAVVPIFTDAATLAPRLGRYLERLAAALAAVNAGDEAMLASPLKDSYHTVWFELHEELILLSGRNRADEAAAGRGA